MNFKCHSTTLRGNVDVTLIKVHLGNIVNGFAFVYSSGRAALAGRSLVRVPANQKRGFAG